MALSGRIDGTCTGSSGDKYNFWADWQVNSQNKTANTSNITVVLKLQRNDGSNTGAYNLSAVNTVNLAVDAEMRVSTQMAIDTRNQQIVTLASWSGNVPHSTDGSLDLEIYGQFMMQGTSLTGGSLSGMRAVDPIDRAPPSVTLTVSNITVTGAKLSAVTDKTCDRWEYSLNNGASWTVYSTATGKNAVITLTTLAPGTSYQTRIRARRSDTGVAGISSVKNISTPGATTIASTAQITADAVTVTLPLLLTCASAAYTHTLVLADSGTDVITISGFTVPAGTGYTTLTLTTAQRDALLARMYTKQSLTLSLTLTTYNGGATVGTSYGSAIAAVYAATSGPVFPGFTYLDTNAITVALTGNNQLLLQKHSEVRVVCSAASARNGAGVISYTAVIGGTSKSSSGTTISGITADKAGILALTVTVTDSRGFTASATQNITVLPYTPPVISNAQARRQNSVEDDIVLTLGGQVYDVTVGGVNKNEVLSLRARVKKTSESVWGAWVNLLPDATVSGNTFTYHTIGALSPDANHSYNLQVELRDKLAAASAYTADIVVPQGTPLLSLRQKMLGINNPNPQAALDVGGDIRMNGEGILGRKTLDTFDYNGLIEQGVYHFDRQKATNEYPDPHAPADPMYHCVVVLRATENYVIQLSYPYSNGVADFYMRVGYYSGSSWTWSSWLSK